jgi:hypothetical protein
MRTIYCKHIIKSKGSFFVYPFGNIELNLCESCESKLRKVILEQVNIETKLNKKKK